MNKRLLGAALALYTMIALSAYALCARSEEAVETVTMWVLCDPSSEVYAREKPSVRAEIAKHLYCGDAVQVDGKEQKDSAGRVWAYCPGLSCERGYGWISKAYLVDSDVTIYYLPKESYVKASGRVRARSAPNGDLWEWLDPGDEVMVYAAGGEWACTNQGYVRREYLPEVMEIDP